MPNHQPTCRRNRVTKNSPRLSQSSRFAAYFSNFKTLSLKRFNSSKRQQMLKRSCQQCGSKIDISLLLCIIYAVLGTCLGWLIGLPNEIAQKFYLENPFIMILIMSRPYTSLILGGLGFFKAFNQNICQQCKNKIMESHKTK